MKWLYITGILGGLALFFVGLMLLTSHAFGQDGSESGGIGCIIIGLIFFITSLVAFILTSGSIPWLFRLIRRTSKYLRK